MRGACESNRTLACAHCALALTPWARGADYGGFGVTLYADPEKFYGHKGIVPYDAVAAGPVGTFRGKAFGAAMTAMAVAAYLERDSTTVLKMFSVASLLMVPLMASNMNDDNFAKEQWKIQLVVHGILTALLCKTAFA